MAEKKKKKKTTTKKAAGVVVKINFVESKVDAGFEAVRGFGAAVLGGIVLGPPGMVAAGISYVALRKTNVLKGPDAAKLEEIMARKEELDKRLSRMNIDMGAIHQAASDGTSTPGESPFVAFSRAFLENNKAIDALASKVHGSSSSSGGSSSGSSSASKLSASEEASISAKLDLLLSRMDELEDKLTKGLEGVHEHLARQDVLLEGIGGNVQRALHSLYRVNNVVDALAEGELVHPRLVLLLPPAKAKKKMLAAGKYFNPKYWLKTELRLHVLCAHSLQPVPLTNGQDGYQVLKPKEWLVKAAPALKATLVVLRVALVAAKVASGLPLPIPSFGAGAEDDKVEALSDALKSFGGAIDGALEESDPLAKEALAPLDRITDGSSAGTALSAAEAQAAQRVTANGYRALGEFLQEVDPGLALLPMQKAVAPDGHVDWVANENVDAWKKGAPYKHKRRPRKKKEKKKEEEVEEEEEEEEEDDGGKGKDGDEREDEGGAGVAPGGVMLQEEEKAADLTKGSSQGGSVAIGTKTQTQEVHPPAPAKCTCAVS